MMHRLMYKAPIVFGWLLLSLGLPGAYAQDVETVLTSKPLEMTGGSISVSSVYFESFEVPSPRPTLSHYASGHLNFNVFGLPAPLSFSYTDRKAAYTQPFNNFSFAPRYRWVAARLGVHNVTYSPYTMAGHTLSGASVELTPGPLTVKLSYGRLQKAVLPSDSNQVTTFQRKGVAAFLAYQWSHDRLYATAFGAQDDPESVPSPLVPEEVKPLQNRALSVGGTKRLFPRLTLDGEFGFSRLHRDVTTTAQKKLSRQQFYAYRTDLKYAGQGYQLSLGFEHVDPNYLTLGGYYFNNDLEKITVGGSTALLESRLNVTAQVGRERNNLRETETNTTQRWVGALNTTWQVSPRFTLAGNYSNFTAFTNVRLATQDQERDELDTLNFYQINQTASSSASWQLGHPERPRTLSANLTYQTAGFHGYGEANNPGTTYGTNTLSYGWGLPQQHLMITTSVNSYVQQSAAGHTRATGPAVSVGKSFLKQQLKNTWSASYNISHQSEAEAPAQTRGLRWNIVYQSSHKREKNQAHTKRQRSARQRSHSLRKKDKGYVREQSGATGLYLSEELSLRKERTQKIKNKTTKTKTENSKKYITERHRFNLNLSYTNRNIPTAELLRSSELTIRASYSYTF